MTPNARSRRTEIAVGLNPGRGERPSSAAGHAIRGWLTGCVLAGLVASLLGCGPHGASSAATGSADAATAAKLAELTQLVRQYGAEQRQVPSSLEDLVARGYLSAVPPAPKGKRFAINKRLEVYLAEAKR